MSVDTAESAPPRQARPVAEDLPHAVPKSLPEEARLRIEPDLAFIRTLMKFGGSSFKKCMQCGTCSATCALTAEAEPFPRKEMIWAVWGMKESLLKDPDVWLCHQCNDCSTRCPRGARPGDVLAAVRQEWVVHQALPGFLARWTSQPQSAPLLLGIMAALLALALYLKDPAAKAFAVSNLISPKIVFSYSSMLPRWLLNGFFIVLGLIVILPAFRGVARVWEAMKSAAARSGIVEPPRKLVPSILAALKGVFSHEKFALCTKTRPRYWSHLAVFYGFLALALVTLWTITAPYNPLLTSAFVYPFSFWNPWKLLANAGGAALVLGCLLMLRDRLKESEQTGVNSFSDWSLIGALLAVALTGFITEVLHYVRLEPHRHLAYFVHLVFVGALLLYMPYSKFAHIIYRTTALICAERYGRTRETAPGESRP